MRSTLPLKNEYEHTSANNSNGLHFTFPTQTPNLNASARANVKILDVKFLSSPKGLLVGFDLISSSFDDGRLLPYSLGSVRENYNTNTTDKDNSELKTLRHLFTISDDSFKNFQRSQVQQSLINDQTSPMPYAKFSIIYPFPSTVHGALNWLSCFVEYINWTRGNQGNPFTAVHFTHYFNEEDFVTGTKNIPSMANYARISKVEDVHINLMKALLSLSPSYQSSMENNEADELSRALLSLSIGYQNSPYASAINAISIMCSAYITDREKKIQKPFYTYNDAKTRMQKLYADLPQAILDPSATVETKQALFDQYARHFLIKNTQLDLQFLQNAIAHIEKQRFIEQIISQSLNKPARDRGMNGFTAAYTEYDVIRNAELLVTPAGKVSIANLENNAGYKKWYAPSTMNHNIFNSEMIHLFKEIGLEFEGAQYHLCLSTEKKGELKPHTLYIESLLAGLIYEVIGLDGLFKTDMIPWDMLPSNFPHDAHAIVTGTDSQLNEILKFTHEKGHTLQNTCDLHKAMVFTEESSRKLHHYWLNCDKYQVNQSFENNGWSTHNNWGMFSTNNNVLTGNANASQDNDMTDAAPSYNPSMQFIT